MSVNNIQTKIEEIRNQTVQYGNTRSKVADLLTLLNTEKLDRDGVIAVVAEITNLAPEFFEYLQTGNFTVDATGFGLPAELTNTPPNSPTVSIHLAFTAGTYTNWKDATNTPITLTGADVADNFVFFFLKDGVVTNVAMSEKREADPAKLPLYSAIKSANIVAGTQFIDDENGNIQYRVKMGQTLLPSELPANVVGTKVESVKTLGVIEGWVSAEAFRFSNFTYNTDGSILDATIIWPDGDTGKMNNIVYSADGITSVRYNKTMTANTKYATMAITYVNGNIANQTITLTGF